MTARQTLRSSIWEAETLVTRARIVRDSDGSTALTSGDVTGWSLRVYDMDAETSGVVYSIDSTVASLVIAPLSTSGWSEDLTGWNFGHATTSSAFAREGGHLIRSEYTVNTVSDGPDVLVHEARVLPMWGT